MVLAAAGEMSGAAGQALEQLCQIYWYPIYAHLRRRGHDAHAAQDLTQGFFTRLLEKGAFQSVSPKLGRFRSFLLACLGNFLANERRNSNTLKRGGSLQFVPLHWDDAEGWYTADQRSDVSADLTYDREWALRVLNQAMERLELEAAGSGKTALFTTLKPFLITPTPDGGYDRVAELLSMTPHSVSMAVMRFRRRFREVVRESVARTVTTPLELEDELRHLRAILSQ